MSKLDINGHCLFSWLGEGLFPTGCGLKENSIKEVPEILQDLNIFLVMKYQQSHM
jgi:hypothetical protein